MKKTLLLYIIICSSISLYSQSFDFQISYGVREVTSLSIQGLQ